MGNASDIFSENEESTENNDTVKKDPEAFRTISEVADEIHVPQHVLRFWETRFKQLQPVKSSGGRRYYRIEDIALLKYISELLYIDGYTIKGVQKLLDDDLFKLAKEDHIEEEIVSDSVSSDNIEKVQLVPEKINVNFEDNLSCYHDELLKLKKEKVFLVHSLQSILQELQELRKIIIKS